MPFFGEAVYCVQHVQHMGLPIYARYVEARRLCVRPLLFQSQLIRGAWRQRLKNKGNKHNVLVATYTRYVEAKGWASDQAEDALASQPAHGVWKQRETRPDSVAARRQEARDFSRAMSLTLLERSGSIMQARKLQFALPCVSLKE